ncbi:DUF2971 domain-containing protein [Photobacterium damselae]|uniref:DUF2971 domain-containing protein n=1 Tax=Photobacterium damselae TaxID=38293 RepID=UPI002542E377
MTNIKYHYTSLDGLLSILTYKTLRFGHVDMMNDPTELKIGEMFIYDFLRKRYKTNRFEHKTITNVVNSHRNRDTYIFCMSDVDEDLNQWRVYGDNGSGVQLSIDVDNLQSYVNQYLEESMGKASKEGLSIPYFSDNVKQCIYLAKTPNSNVPFENDNNFYFEFMETDTAKEASKFLSNQWDKHSLDDYFEVASIDGCEMVVTKNIALQVKGKPIDHKTMFRSVECLSNIEKIVTEFKAIVKDDSYKVENEHRSIIYADKTNLQFSNQNEFNSEGIYIKDIFTYYKNSYGLSSCIDVPISGNSGISNVITNIKLGCNSNRGNLKTIQDILKYKWGYLPMDMPTFSESSLRFR